jgi:predicted PurR-regulated permease PerM
MPIVAAVLLYFVLAPVVEFLVRHRIPRLLASFVVTAMLAIFIWLAIYALAGPAIDWLEKAPASIQELRSALRDQPNPLADIREASDAVEQAVADITEGSEGTDGPNERPATVRIVEADLVENLITSIPRAVLALGLTLLLTAFLLLSSKQILRGLVTIGRDLTARRHIVSTARQVEAEIGRYLGTIMLINAGLALVVAGAMQLLGLPNPLLWGAAAGLLNFAPYLGPILCTGLIGLASIEAMTGLQAIVLPPLVFILITAVEGQVVTPLLLGRSLQLSPIVVLLSVVVTGWIWGLVGALMAVPLVAALRICLADLPGCDGLSRLLRKD